jgi:HSP20 family molecular chaperone IbpA
MRTMGLAPVMPPHARVDESKDEYVVCLPVPGFAITELEIELTDRVVTVRGDQTKVDPETPFRVHEQLEEHFRLPADVDLDRVSARYAHGQIELHAPRGSVSLMRPRKLPLETRLAVNADASGV